MNVLATLAGIALILVAVWDMFEAVILPRTVSRKFRMSRLFYRSTWWVCRAVAQCLPWRNSRVSILSTFGPLSLPVLLGCWAFCILFGFALLQWGLGSHLGAPSGHPAARLSLGAVLYWSGTTFFTLGYGDVVPHTSLARTLAVLEAGVGFGFLAIVISYLPVLYQSFSRREVGISLLDSRAGSPPSAVELIRRYGQHNQLASLADLLAEFERWAADLLESHLSYPVLAFYRSQHDRQSWLAALTTVLDACTLVLLGFKDHPTWEKNLLWQARHTFAMCRHAAVDLALVLGTPPEAVVTPRLEPESLNDLKQALAHDGVHLCDDEAADEMLIRLRRQYEPYLAALADRLLLTLPEWSSPGEVKDNWQTSAWEDGVHF